jgi:hypothetical protein
MFEAVYLVLPDLDPEVPTAFHLILLVLITSYTVQSMP